MPQGDEPTSSSFNRPTVRWGLWITSLAALIAAAGSIGGSQGAGLALIVVVETVFRSGWPALVYLVTAYGFGTLLGRTIPRSIRPVQFALGLAALMTISHLLGSLGLLNTWTVAALSVIGVVGAARPLLRNSRSRLGPPAGWAWISLPAIALLLTAAASPPGALWESEYGGYDVLSYHLQLPAEWLALGHTRPLEHNVYSFLPGSLEIAYTYLGLLSGAGGGAGAGAGGGAGAGAGGLLEGGGWRLMSAQYLHVGLTIAAAWLVCRLARRLAFAAKMDSRASRIASTVAGGLVLCTPWTIVVGSMAYNEMGVVALGAGALLAACGRSCGRARQRGGVCRGRVGRENGQRASARPTRPTRHTHFDSTQGALVPGSCCTISWLSPSYEPLAQACGVFGQSLHRLAPVERMDARFVTGIRMTPVLCAMIVGFLVGVACCVKPTALFFVGIPAGVMLVLFLPRRDRPRVIAAGALAGILALSPWLVRNAAMTGNPVFPLATDLFGTGHWTPGQADRWESAHTFDGSFGDRLRLIAWPDPATEPTANPVARWRGATNPQWLVAFPVGLLGGALLLLLKRPRLIAAGLLVGLAGQLGAWVMLTHLQSRFLIPCLLTLAPLAGLGAAWLGTARLGTARLGTARLDTARWSGVGVGLLVCAVQVVGAWMNFANQRDGSPNALLLGGPSLFLGEPYTPEVGAVWPVAFVNHELPTGARVLLVGGATPLYFDRRVIYSTVWDRPPVLDFMESVDTSGMPTLDYVLPDYVLIDYSELSRQSQSGYLDPALTPGFIGALVGRLDQVRSWPESGQTLYRVRRGARP